MFYPALQSLIDHVEDKSLSAVRRVKYFTETLTQFPNIDLDHSSQKALQAALSTCAKNLLKIPKLTIQQAAYIITALNTLFQKKYFGSCLSILARTIAGKWLTNDFAPHATEDIRYQVQFFYQLVKFLKNNPVYFKNFFSIPDVNTLTHRNILSLTTALAQNPRTQSIANLFLSLGYLARLEKVYEIPGDMLTSLLNTLFNNACAQAIATVFLCLGYLAQQGKTYHISFNTDVFTQLHATKQLQVIELRQIIPTFYRLHYFLDAR